MRIQRPCHGAGGLCLAVAIAIGGCSRHEQPPATEAAAKSSSFRVLKDPGPAAPVVPPAPVREPEVAVAVKAPGDARPSVPGGDAVNAPAPSPGTVAPTAAPAPPSVQPAVPAAPPAPAARTPAAPQKTAPPIAPVVPPAAPVAPTAPAVTAPGVRVAPPDPFDPQCLRPGCHDALQKTDRIHGPVAAGVCAPCHEPAPPGHHFTLTRPQPELCTFCHLSAPEKQFVHAPLKKDVCTACHNPHGSGSKFMLKKNTTAEHCATCHALPVLDFVHGPVAVGACMLCHEAHQSDFPHLVREPGSQQCTRCHADAAAAFTTKKYVHKPAVQDCASCHMPHYGNDRRFLRKPADELCYDCHKNILQETAERPVVHGALKELERCSNCHTSHAADRPFLLKDQSAKLCLQCHDKEIVLGPDKKLANIAAILAATKFQHGPIREGDCIACHNAHASVNYRLLRQTFPQEFYSDFDVKNYALCFSCHQQTLVLHEETSALTGFRDGFRNLHFVHVNKQVKGRTCRACHEIHASNLPKHLREGVPFGPSGWLLPINFTKSEHGGTCSPGCHKPMAYDRTKNGAPPAPDDGADAGAASAGPGNDDMKR